MSETLGLIPGTEKGKLQPVSVSLLWLLYENPAIEVGVSSETPFLTVGNCRSKVRVKLLLSEASLLGLQMAPFSLAFFFRSSICGSLSRFPLPPVRPGQDPLQRPLIDPAYKDLQMPCSEGRAGAWRKTIKPLKAPTHSHWNSIWMGLDGDEGQRGCGALSLGNG